MSTPPAQPSFDKPVSGLPTVAPGPQANTPRTVDSQTLLQGHALLLIQHQGETYRLQATRQGKLILTK